MKRLKRKKPVTHSSAQPFATSWMTEKEVLELLGINEILLKRLRYTGKITKYNVPGKEKYIRKEVEEYLQHK